MPPSSDTAEPTGDPLGAVLHLLEPEGTFYCQSRLRAPWGIEVPGFFAAISFILVTEGAVYLQHDQRDNGWLRAGSLTLFPHGWPFRVASAPGTAARSIDALPTRPVSELFETLELAGPGPETRILFGMLRLNHAASDLIRAALPAVVHIPPDALQDDTWLRETVAFIAREGQARRPGGEAILRRLADVVVLDGLRRWMDGPEAAGRGWLGAVRDRPLARAIQRIHDAPGEPWTLPRLAAAAGLSRSAFAARFAAKVGMTPAAYLTRWRMHLARGRLANGGEPVAVVAEDLGYRSEAAFNRAFKRVFGETPGLVRGTRSPGPAPRQARKDLD